MMLIVMPLAGVGCFGVYLDRSIPVTTLVWGAILGAISSRRCCISTPSRPSGDDLITSRSA